MKWGIRPEASGYFEQLSHDGEATIGCQPFGDGVSGRDEDTIDGVDVAVASLLLPAFDGGALHRSADGHRVEERHLRYPLKKKKIF